MLITFVVVRRVCATSQHVLALEEIDGAVFAVVSRVVCGLAQCLDVAI